MCADRKNKKQFQYPKKMKEGKKINMKTAKKLFALALVLTMVLAMAATASAADSGGTIKITGTNTDREYRVIKMFSITNTTDGYICQADTSSAWANFDSVASEYLSIDDEGYVIWNGGVNLSPADKAAFAETAKKYAKDNNLIQPVATVKVGNETPVSIADDGYYLLLATDDTGCGVEVIALGEEVVITEKTGGSGGTVGLPYVVKLVEEDSTGVYGTSNTVDIGQTINFKTTIYAEPGGENYTLHDTMPDGMTFNGVSSVTFNGTELGSSDYTVNTSPADGGTFEVEFTDTFHSSHSLMEGDQIIVSYTATLNDSAQVGTIYTNTTWLTYTEEDVKTSSSSTTTQTFQITATKYGKTTATALEGAEFVLKRSDGKYYQVTDKIVSWVDSKDSATPVTSGEDGTFVFYGIDADSYHLVEIKAPSGYVLPAESDSKSVEIVHGSQTANVFNTLSDRMPETGGIGTTVFYIAGGAGTAAHQEAHGSQVKNIRIKNFPRPALPGRGKREIQHKGEHRGDERKMADPGDHCHICRGIVLTAVPHGQ